MKKAAQFYHRGFRCFASNAIPKERLMSIVPHPEEQNLLNEKMPSFTQLLLPYHLLNISSFSARKELIKPGNMFT